MVQIVHDLMVARPQNTVPDTWLSEILARPTFKLVVNDEFVENVRNSTTAEAEQLARLMRSKPLFIYSKVAIDAFDQIAFLEERGFHLVDTNVFLQRPIISNDNFREDDDVRFAAADDESETVRLAARTFQYSRFHMDKNFSKESADRVKTEWVRNYFRGQRGDYMVVAVQRGKVTGFLQLLHSPDGLLTIDLIAVDSHYRRQGFSKKMIAFAMTHCPDCSSMLVGTQLMNTASIRLYEEMGFRMKSATYVFHFHHMATTKAVKAKQTR